MTEPNAFNFLVPDRIMICARCGYAAWRDGYPCNRCGGLEPRVYVPLQNSRPGEQVMERAIIYVCPTCDRSFDSPSTCMSDGATAKPVLSNVTREQYPTLAHRPGYCSFPIHGVVVADCSCGWASKRLPLGTSPEALEAAFAAHVGATVR